jgi:hypothetical protein
MASMSNQSLHVHAERVCTEVQNFLARQLDLCHALA